MVTESRARALIHEALPAPDAERYIDWDDVLRRATDGSRQVAPQTLRGGSRAWTRRRSRLLLVAAVLAVLVFGGTAYGLAETFLVGDPAPPEQEAALQALFPPYGIGEATTLARHDGRTLIGARTKRGDLCLSATSPLDPRGEGGTCLSARDTRRLNDGHMVAVPMSGGSVGGYAPGARAVRVTGPGIDAVFPVHETGWWVGAIGPSFPPVPARDGYASIVALGVGVDGKIIGRDLLLAIPPLLRPSSDD